MFGGGDGEVWDSSVGAVPCVLGPTIEAKLHEGIGWLAYDGECGGCASTCKNVRRAKSLPQVHEIGGQQFQSCGENRRLEVLARSWPLARAWDLTLYGWSWIGKLP